MEKKEEGPYTVQSVVAVVVAGVVTVCVRRTAVMHVP